MITKLEKPIIFDKAVDSVVIARDGEKFYVCKKEMIEEVDDGSIHNLVDLLSWAIMNDYPIGKFVSAQRRLSDKFTELL